MPKRKRVGEDAAVAKKLRKIEKLLKTCKNRRIRIISSSSEDSSQSLQDHNGGEVENSSGDASEIDSILIPMGQSRQENITAQRPATPSPAQETPVPQPSTSQETPLPSTSREAPPPSLPQEVTPLPSTSQEVEINTEVDIVQSTEQSTLDNDILELLGDDPTAIVKYGKDIRPELATRFNHIATNGLNKDVRKELCDKYLLPGNCTMIGAPMLNTEIKSALNETALKRDKLMEYRQKRLAAAISCLGEALSYALDAKEKDNAQIKRLMDTARLMCDTQYNDSTSRRNLAVSSLKKEMKEPLLNTKIDTSLFGETLSDSLKTAKAVTKSATELKHQFKPAQSKNWRAPVAGRKQPAPTGSTTTTGRRNAPAAPMTSAQPAPPPPPAAEPRVTRNYSSRKPPPPPTRYTRRRY